MGFADTLLSGSSWAGFLLIAVALMLLFDLIVKVVDGWKKLMKPKVDEIDRRTECDKKFDRDFKDIHRLEEQQEKQDEAIMILIRTNLAILNQLLHNGNKDEMSARVRDIENFLLERKVKSNA